MLRRFAVITLMLLSLTLTGCVSAASGLKAYVDSIDGYEFLYPNGWVPVAVSSGADVVFRDLIQTTDNVSVVVSDVTSGKQLSDLGTPTEVGQRLAKRVIAPENSGREAELVAATEHQAGNQRYYTLEYVTRLLPSAATTGDTSAAAPQRHNLAAIAVSRGKLYTLSVSTPESRWEKSKPVFERMANSFSVY
jgi:photosystem II oxygen-evolving enhancer protein 2